jgi:hypothetical protein
MADLEMLFRAVDELTRTSLINYMTTLNSAAV